MESIGGGKANVHAANGSGSAGAGAGFSGFPNSNCGMRLPDIGMGLPLQIPSTKINGNSSSSSSSSSPADAECTVREQDRFMPIANVIRIMRKILPPHAKISDDAKETIQECVSEFISFITGEANERCQREQRKTITAEDVLWAMSKLGFDDYIEPLTLYLHRHREFDSGERGSLRGEPMGIKRAVDHSVAAFGGIGPAGFGQAPPPHFHLPQHPVGYFGAPVNGFLNKNIHSSSSNGEGSSSQDQLADNGEQAFGVGQSKE